MDALDKIRRREAKKKIIDVEYKGIIALANYILGACLTYLSGVTITTIIGQVTANFGSILILTGLLFVSLAIQYRNGIYRRYIEALKDADEDPLR
jgi:hypothetical protein